MSLGLSSSLYSISQITCYHVCTVLTPSKVYAMYIYVYIYIPQLDQRCVFPTSIRRGPGLWVSPPLHYYTGLVFSEVTFSKSLLSCDCVSSVGPYLGFWYTGWFFNCSSQFSVPKWKTMGNQSEILFHEILDVQKILVGWTLNNVEQCFSF